MIEGFAAQRGMFLECGGGGLRKGWFLVVDGIKTVVQSKAALNAVVVLKRVIAANSKDPKV